jgi:hypothetical protein
MHVYVKCLVAKVAMYIIGVWSTNMSISGCRIPMDIKAILPISDRKNFKILK